MKMYGQIHDYLAQLGRRGGSAKSKAKANASRQNGKLGGRPKKARNGDLMVTGDLAALC